MAKKRIAWLTNDWAQSQYREIHDLYGGIGYYRVISPSRVLRKYYDIEVIGSDFKHWGTEDETYTRLGTKYDLIITKHIMSGRQGSNILAIAKHFNKKVILDLDDNYLEMRKDNYALKDYDVGKEGRYYVSAMLELADGVTVSTDPLKDAYSKFNKNIDVLPNCNNYKEWPKPFQHTDNKIRIGYAGGTAHNDDLELIIEPIAKILQKYPDVIFEVISALTPGKAMELGAKMLKFGDSDILERFIIKGGTEAWQGYPEFLCSQGWDIGIAPLVNEPFNQGKSHIKWMEYSMAGAATVASPVHPYIYPIDGIKVIQHGKTGLLATNTEQWFESLEQLVTNRDYRKKIAHNAYQDIKKHWQQKQWADKWRFVIDKYL